MSAVLDNGFFKLPPASLIISLILHAFLPLLFVTLSYMADQGLIPFMSPRKLDKSMYQNFIQVDVVALPDELINEKKRVDMSLPVVETPATAPEEVKATTPEETLTDPEVAKKEAEQLLKKEQEKKAAAERLIKEKERLKEQEKALKRIQEDAAREAALKSLAAKEGKSGRKKQSGNLLSKGTATSGMIGTAKERYTGLVHEAIKEHFNIFAWQKKKNLLTVVRIEIFATGRVRAKNILKPSGDGIYDKAVLRAIDAAQPLPIPEDMSIVSDGIVVEFKPE